MSDLFITIRNQNDNAVKLKQLLQENREEILNIAEKHGAFNVRIFGSVAKSEETETSDIDFLIDYDLNKISPWFPGGLLMDLQDLLGCKVDIVTEKSLSKFIKNRVLAEAKPL
jgi:predicted nucleotidyltransferase